jgi:hypothetical protein
MRSALDQLIVLLVELAGAAVHQRHQFRILSDRADWVKAVPVKSTTRGCLDGVPIGQQSSIERMQPYHVPRSDKANALFDINGLWNADKHRLIHVAATSLKQNPTASVMWAYDGQVASVSSPPAGTVLRGEVEVARARPTQFHGRQQAQLHVGLKLAVVFGAAGDERLQLSEIRGRLASFRDIVRELTN